MTERDAALSAGQKVVFDNHVHWIVSIFPKSSMFYGKLLLNLVRNPKPVTLVIAYDERQHKKLTEANQITD